MRKPLTKKTMLFWMWRHWSWLAKNPEELKGNFHRILSMSEYIRALCFACEYFCVGRLEENKEENGTCEACITVFKNLWPAGCMKTMSPYIQWKEAEQPEEQRKYATIIADEAHRLWLLENKI